MRKSDAIPRPNNTHTHTMWKIRRARYTNTSTVTENLIH